MIEDNDIFGANATAIAGLLVLLTISSLGNLDVLQDPLAELNKQKQIQESVLQNLQIQLEDTEEPNREYILQKIYDTEYLIELTNAEIAYQKNEINKSSEFNEITNLQKKGVIALVLVKGLSVFLIFPFSISSTLFIIVRRLDETKIIRRYKIAKALSFGGFFILGVGFIIILIQTYVIQ